MINKNATERLSSSLPPVDGETHMEQLVSIYSQVASSPELKKLRANEAELFDSLIESAVSYALHAAAYTVRLLNSDSDTRNYGAEISIEQHLPTAINFAQQIVILAEVQGNRGIFEMVFATCMPVVLETAQQVHEVKLESEIVDSDAHDELFAMIIDELPSTIMDSLIRAMGEATPQKENGDQMDNGFLEILKKVAPIILNVANAASSSHSGRVSLSYVPPPTDRGFYESLKQICMIILDNDTIKKIANSAIFVGVERATKALVPKQGTLYLEEAWDDYAEAHVRGKFGGMLQIITPIGITTLDRAIGISTIRSLGNPVAQKNTFDVFASAVPAMLAVARKQFENEPSSTAADAAKYLRRVLPSAIHDLVLSASRQTRNSETGIFGAIDRIFSQELN